MTQAPLKAQIPTYLRPAQQIDQQRGEAYGPYMSNAVMAQEIRNAVRRSDGMFYVMPADERLSIDEIALKISRIVCGRPNQLDSWQDVAGYANLIVKRMEEEQKQK